MMAEPVEIIGELEGMGFGGGEVAPPPPKKPAPLVTEEPPPRNIGKEVTTRLEEVCEDAATMIQRLSQVADRMSQVATGLRAHLREAQDLADELEGLIPAIQEEVNGKDIS